jgi:hypothetical protein
VSGHEPPAPSGGSADADRQRALAAVRTELAALGTPPAPPERVEAWAAALRAEAGPSRHLRTPRRRQLRATALAAAAVAGALTVGAVLAGQESTAPGGPAGRPGTDVTRADLRVVAAATVGIDGLGPLTDPDRRADCLATAGAAPVADTEVLGGRPVRFDGSDGTLLVLATGERGVLRVLVVGADCRAVLTDTTPR